MKNTLARLEPRDSTELLTNEAIWLRSKFNFRPSYGVPTNKVPPCLRFDEKRILNDSLLRRFFSFPEDRDCLALDKMNHDMKYKDTLELLERHPHYFQSLQYLNDCEHHRPWRKTFVFAQPRSGSTLLMRLLSGASLTKMIGDKHPDVYTSALTIYENVRDNNGHYLDAVSSCEKTGIFPDEYRGYESRDRETWNTRGAISQLIFGNTFGSGYAKSTCIGLTQEPSDTVVRFATMLRELFEDKEDLRIVWLIRDTQAIINSLKSRDVKFDEAQMFDSLENQKRAFKTGYDLGDVKLNYDDWIKEPIKTILRLNPIYIPNVDAVNKIMNKIIR